jgi:hypothetical protein
MGAKQAGIWQAMGMKMPNAAGIKPQIARPVANIAGRKLKDATMYAM